MFSTFSSIWRPNIAPLLWHFYITVWPTNTSQILQNSLPFSVSRHLSIIIFRQELPEKKKIIEFFAFLPGSFSRPYWFHFCLAGEKIRKSESKTETSSNSGNISLTYWDPSIRWECLCRKTGLITKKFPPWSSWIANSHKKYMEFKGAAWNVNKPCVTSWKTTKDKHWLGKWLRNVWASWGLSKMQTNQIACKFPQEKKSSHKMRYNSKTENI